MKCHLISWWHAAPQEGFFFEINRKAFLAGRIYVTRRGRRIALAGNMVLENQNSHANQLRPPPRERVIDVAE